jgi:hypothetical protein
MLRIPHCLDNGLTDGAKIVSSMRRPRFTLQKHVSASDNSAKIQHPYFSWTITKFWVIMKLKGEGNRLRKCTCNEVC